ncbi:MAG: helicase-related protein [Parvularculaceae bacterium]
MRVPAPPPDYKGLVNPGPVTAVLGPTNTGKTHYALERMLACRTGMIGLPLRLLAREIYDRVAALRGAREVALVTGEEKILPPSPRYWVCTVEAMPLERSVDFLAIDEVQLAADPERGRIFTSRLLHARGRSETLLLGSDTIRPALQRLFAGARFVSRPRFSALTHAGPKKVTRLPRRSAVVAFSSDSVYALAELIRRQRGGAAVVLGALSPRTRNAQAALYQNGEVDYLVATDAIGMGLNMDIDHVAFAALRKFDGRGVRQLNPAELAQIAGRAGRHVRDGTFGVTGDCPPLDDETAAAIEDHRFDAIPALQWRSEALDYSSLPALFNALEKPAPRPELRRARPGEDEQTLQRLAQRRDIRDMAQGGAALSLLWDVCQTPDFRKTAPDQHARLLGDIYRQLVNDGRIGNDWLAAHVDPLDRVDGDIDVLSTRIAHIRTWTYVSHRGAWLENAGYWRERARAIEDSLSDALHEKLTQRFVDRRTSVLLRRLKDDAPLLAGVTEDGEVIVEGQFVGRLLGFEFILDPRASGAEAKSVRAAAERALRPVFAARAAALANAQSHELDLREDGSIWWRSGQAAQLEKGPAPLRPALRVKGLDVISPHLRGRVEDRLADFFSAKVEALLSPLLTLQRAANAGGDDGLQGLTRGVAFRLVENFGATSRAQFGDDLRQLDQKERGKLRQLGVRFGEYTIFMPALLKPAPASLLTMLWALWTDRQPAAFTPPKAGLVSTPLVDNLPHAYYYASGYRPSGARAVRIDMLERLAHEIRAVRRNGDPRQGFEATAHMMSFVGCSGEEFEAILHSLGFRKTIEKRPAPKPELATAAVVPKEAVEAAPDETAPAPVHRDAPAPVENASENAIVPEQAEAQEATPCAAQQPSADPAPAPVQSSDDGAATAQSKEDSEAVAAPAEIEHATAVIAPQPEVQSEAEEIEIAVWRPAPRHRPKPKPKPTGKSDAKSDHGRKHAAKSKREGRGGKPERRKFQDGPRIPDGKPRYRKTADPNSPFAVLAGLKDSLSKPEKKPAPADPPDPSEKAR